MSVTFHRAFDMCSNPFTGLSDVIATGADRLLTSGQMNDALSGAALISQLRINAGTKIIVMPGGGLNPSNIKTVAETTGAAEFHMTGRKITESGMKFRRNGISMGGINSNEFKTNDADPELIRNVVRILKMI